MSRKKREWYPGAIYHVMSRGNRRTVLFKDKADYLRFLECVERAGKVLGFQIHALCLKTNHFHMTIETADTELWKIMQRILHPYSMDFNHKYHFTGHLFESRYTACIIEDEVSLAHNGVLFLDEIAEFSRSTLDSLRQPMEDKRVTISRVNETNTYPANFMVVTAMNACSSLHNRGPADQWLCGICWNCRRKTVHSGGKEQVNRSCFGGCERRESSHQRNGEGN